MVGCREYDIVLEQTGEFPGECRGKLWSPIRDHLRVEAKSRENIGKKELGHSSGINVFCAGAVNYPLCKAMVYHDHDQVKSVGVW